MSRQAWFLLFLLCGVGCCPTGHSTYLQQLKNEGPLLLSTANPYVAPNLFLAQERKSNPVIAGFMKIAGTPEAIEIKKGFLGSTELFFYYLKSKESYSFKEADGNWLITGPTPVPPYVLVKFLDNRDTPTKPLLLDEPPLDTENKKEQEKKQDDKLLPHLHEVPKAVEKVIELKSENEDTAPTEELSAADRFAEMEQTDQAVEEASEELEEQTASESNSGDIVHVVKYPGETLRMLASWYTDRPDNAGRIARINSIRNPNLLMIGQKIRIPRYLLKTSKVMTEEDIKKYVNSTSGKHK